MGKKKHQFINKKSAHKFNVVHRSQRDPLQADEESSQHVLVPVGGTLDIASSSQSNTNQEEQIKFGIFYDDDYDYLQHLKPRGEGMFIMADEPRERSGPSRRPIEESFAALNIPAEVMPSKYEVDIGMLNKGVLPRGPQPDWDPDIVAALDDDLDMDDPDNILGDDFMSLANAEGGEYEGDNDYDGDDDYEGGDDEFDMNAEEFILPQKFDGSGTSRNNFGDKQLTKSDDEWETESDVSSTGNFDCGDLSDFNDSEEETKSRFTNYSMTSSVIRRTQGLKVLDDHFERIMEEYDDEEIGSIDHNDPTGTFSMDNPIISHIVDEFIEQHSAVPLSEVTKDDDDDDLELDVSESDDECDAGNDDKLFEEFEKKKGEKWDCESIISTYSNLYNHPKILDEPVRLHKRTNIPLGVFNDNKKTQEKEEENIDIDTTPVILNNIRKKGETPEEKKNRKNEVKELRRNRRKEKNENKQFFKDEHKKQQQIASNKANQIGMKI